MAIILRLNSVLTERPPDPCAVLKFARKRYRHVSPDILPFLLESFIKHESRYGSKEIMHIRQLNSAHLNPYQSLRIQLSNMEAALVTAISN